MLVNAAWQRGDDVVAEVGAVDKRAHRGVDQGAGGEVARGAGHAAARAAVFVQDAFGDARGRNYTAPSRQI